MTYRTYNFGGTIFTKTMKALKAEAHKRRNKLYEARHKYDAIRLISMMLAFGLAVSTAVYA
jgi:hypothetical protein